MNRTQFLVTTGAVLAAPLVPIVAEATPEVKEPLASRWALEVFCSDDRFNYAGFTHDDVFLYPIHHTRYLKSIQIEGVRYKFTNRGLGLGLLLKKGDILFISGPYAEVPYDVWCRHGYLPYFNNIEKLHG